jgi:imidazolonepropionase-like amidohydrolase
MAQHCAHTGESRIYEETIQLMLKRGFYCGTQWGPLTDEEKRQVREGRFSTTDYDLENSIRLIKAGVPQLVSTDAGTIDPDVLKDFGPEGPWGGLGGRNAEICEAEFINMQAMQDRGMTPMMILQAATKNIAAAYKKLDVLGTLEAGKYADLLVLEADPLADIANMRKIAMVVKDGKTVDTNSLPTQVILTSPEAKDPGPIRER